MQSSESKVSPLLSTRLVSESAHHPAERHQPDKLCGALGMEPRVLELEAQLKHIRNALEEVRSDINSIKHRIAYSTGAAGVIIGVVGWVANSRFDQLVLLLTR